uniref:DUF971 domain-containing protein n=1 Tax=Macrostomum lignano TaxID=282301 RepID=A0A1I8H7R4_9PLAT
MAMATLRFIGRQIVLGKQGPGLAASSTLRRALATTVGSVDKQKRLLTVRWSDKSRRDSLLPLAWLRDNCQCSGCFHPDTLSRLQLMENFDPKIGADSVQFDDASKTCSVTWSDGHVSTYKYEWLMRRSFDSESQQQRSLWYSGKHELWGSDYVIRRHPFDQ